MKLPSREIDRDFPGRGLPVAGSPNSDEQKCRDQCELVEGIKEEQIERSESADRAAGNEKQTGVKRAFVAARFRR